MFERLKGLLKTTTARQSLLTTISTGINGLLGAAFYFLLARFLQPNQYGVFSVVVALITMLGDVFDFGGNQALVKFIPEHGTDHKKISQTLNFVLLIKTLSGVVVTGVILIFSRFIAANFLGKPELSSVMLLVGVGVMTQLWFSFSTNLAQAKEKFWAWSGLFVLSNATRFSGMLILFTYGLLTANSALYLYIGIPFVFFVISFWIFKIKINVLNFDTVNFKKMFNFNGWVTAFIIVGSIGARVDTFLTAKYLSLTAVGIYSLANQIVSILPQLTGAIGAVTTPKYASFNTLDKNSTYTIKASMLTTVVAVFSSVVLVPLGFLIVRFSGKDYLSALPPMMILLGAMVLFLMTAPIRDSILYFFAKPKFFFWAGLAQIALSLVLSSFLIPRYQILGSSLTVLGQQVLMVVASGIYFLYCKNHYGKT